MGGRRTHTHTCTCAQTCTALFSHTPSHAHTLVRIYAGTRPRAGTGTRSPAPSHVHGHTHTLTQVHVDAAPPHPRTHAPSHFTVSTLTPHVHNPALVHLLTHAYAETHTEPHPHSDTPARGHSGLPRTLWRVTDPSSHVQTSSSFDKSQPFHLAHELANLPLPTQ